MNDTLPLIERMRPLIGRECSYYGRRCRIIELLAPEARLVLEARDALPPIQPDQYGQAAYRSFDHVEVPLFDGDGGYSDDLLHLLESVGGTGPSRHGTGLAR